MVLFISPFGAQSSWMTLALILNGGRLFEEKGVETRGGWGGETGSADSGLGSEASGSDSWDNSSWVL